MKYLKEYNSHDELNLLEDFLLEYLEKWKLCENSKYYEMINPHTNDESSWKRKSYKGTYEIRKVSTNFFGVKGFPNKKSGYLVDIVFFFKPINEDEFKKDMMSFIKRFCLEDYKSDTLVDTNGTLVHYYISFFK